MSGTEQIVGVFSYVDTTQDAIERLKAKGVKDVDLHMPTYIHELAEAIDDTPSPVRWVTLLGGLTGFVCAILMTGWMSLDWPVRPSMKPVLSWAAYTVIMFELTVLLGGLFNLGALFGFARLPKLNPGPGFDPRFTDDKFGLVVGTAGATAEEIETLLNEAGAEEVRRA